MGPTDLPKESKSTDYEELTLAALDAAAKASTRHEQQVYLDRAAMLAAEGEAARRSQKNR
jgi:hypothetical protein